MPTTICVRSPAVARQAPRRKPPVSLDLSAMILNCPACGTRYLVDEQALHARTGRIVRCASCGHTWHQAALQEPHPKEETATEPGGRIEPALEVPPRPGGTAAPLLEVPPRPRLVPQPPPRARRSRWAVLRWLLLVVLFVLAIIAGIFVARGAVAAIWPPGARLYALAGLPVACARVVSRRSGRYGRLRRPSWRGRLR